MLGPARDPARPPTTCTMPPAHTALAVHTPARARAHTYTNTNAHSPPEPARLAKAAESRQRPAQATWEVSKKLRGMEGKTDSTARSPSAKATRNVHPPGSQAPATLSCPQPVGWSGRWPLARAVPQHSFRLFAGSAPLDSRKFRPHSE